MKIDRLALGLEVLEVAEQLVDLVGHEHRRRLVEDEDLRPAEQHLEDLDPLPLTDFERLDERVWVDPRPYRSPSSSMRRPSRP